MAPEGVTRATPGDERRGEREGGATRAAPGAPPSGPGRRGRRRRLSAGKRALFAACSLGVLFGVPEVFFQVREVVREDRKPRLPLAPDAYRDVVLVPGAVYERPDQGRRARINAHGMRGPEVGPKRADTLRIACVGGSTTFGLYASDDDSTWPALLGADLRAAGRRAETLNAGAPGWTLRSSLNNLELRVFALEPDVVVCYHAYNDLMALSRDNEARYRADSHVDDVEALRRPEDAQSLLARSALFRFARSRVRSPHSAFQEKQDAIPDEAYAAFARNLERLVRRCRERDVALVLCTFPTAFRDTEERSVADGVPDLRRWYGALSPFSYPLLIGGLARMNEVVRGVAAAHDVPLVDLAARFPHDVALYASPLHHSDEGERLVARMIREALEEAGLLGRPPGAGE